MSTRPAPEYQQRTTASGGGGMALLQNAPNTDAGVGDALRQLGDGAGRLGQQIHTQRVEVDGQHATKTASEFAAWSAEQLTAIERTPTPDLPAAVQKYREEAQAFRQKAIGGLRTREGAQYQGRLLDSYDAHATERLGTITRFAADQDKLQSQDATISNSAAAVEKAPELFGTTLAQTLAGIDQSGLTIETRAKMAVRARDTLALSATSGLMAKDIQGAAKELGPDGGKLAATRELDPKVREQLYQRATVEAQHARVAQLAAPVMQAMAADTRQGTAALLALEDDKTLSDEDKLAVREAVRTQTNLLQDERARQYGETMAAISRRVENKTAGPRDMATVVGVYRKSGLTDAQYASYVSRIEGAMMERARGQAAAADLAAIGAQGIPLDPHNSDHKKFLDTAYDHSVAQLAPQDPRRHTVALALASQYRMLPSSEVSWMTAVARSPSPQVALLGAQLFGSLKAQAPEVLSQLDDHTRMFLGQVSADAEIGVLPQQAFDTARALTFDVPKAVQDMRASAWKEGLHSPQSEQLGVLNTLASRDFKTGWFSSAAPTTELLAAFNQRTEELYKVSGNLQRARDSAWTDLKRVYGVTKVNGVDTLTPMPIEQFGVKPEEVRKEVSAAVEGLDIKPDDVLVVADANTLRQMHDMMSGRPVMPTYALWTKDGQRVYKDGVPQVYTPPDLAELRQRFFDSQNKADAQGQMEINKAREYRKNLEEAAVAPHYNADDPYPFGSIGQR